MTLAGLVLCGGRGARMGRDKALIEIDGESLVRRVARRLAEVADPVLLAPGARGRLGEVGFAEVADAEPGQGPLGGIVAGLRASPHDRLAVVAVDMPDLEPRLLAWLATLLGDHDAAVPVTDRGPEPLHAVYSRRALPPLAEALAAGRRSMAEALAGTRVHLVGADRWRSFDPDGRFARNLNTPHDLARLRRSRPATPTTPGRRRR